MKNKIKNNIVAILDMVVCLLLLYRAFYNPTGSIDIFNLICSVFWFCLAIIDFIIDRKRFK